MALFSRIVLLAVFLLTAPVLMAQQAPQYTVKRGDTLFRIAQAHNLTVEKLRELNNLRSNQIEVGQVLIVGSAATTPTNQAPEAYMVKAGDTLFSIARRHEVTVADLRSWNGITGNTIAVGQRLRLRAPAASPRTQPVTPQRPPATPTPRTDEPARAARGTPQAQDADATVPRDTLQEYGRHEVVPGETLYGIGLRYGLPVDTLLALNPDLGTMLEPGLVLQLPPGKSGLTF